MIFFTLSCICCSELSTSLHMVWHNIDSSRSVTQCQNQLLSENVIKDDFSWRCLRNGPHLPTLLLLGLKHPSPIWAAMWNRTSNPFLKKDSQTNEQAQDSMKNGWTGTNKMKKLNTFVKQKINNFSTFPKYSLFVVIWLCMKYCLVIWHNWINWFDLLNAANFFSSVLGTFLSLWIY